MKRSRGRRVALAVAAVGLCVLGVTGYALRDRIAALCYSWALERAEDDEDAQATAAKLAELGDFGRGLAEDWYIEQLRSDRAEPALHALERLTDLRSLKAIGPVCSFEGAKRGDSLQSGRPEFLRRIAWKENHFFTTVLDCNPSEAIDGLIRAARDEDAGAREAACVLLSRGPPGERPLVQALCRCLRDERGAVREAAAHSLWQLRKRASEESLGDRPTAESLGAECGDGESETECWRRLALLAAVELNADGARIRPALAALQREPPSGDELPRILEEPNLRRHAALCARLRVVRELDADLDQLLFAMDHLGCCYRRDDVIGLGLGLLPRRGEKAFRVCLELLKLDAEMARLLAVYATDGFGLLQVLPGAGVESSREIGNAVGRLGISSGLRASVLIPLLASDDAGSRRGAAVALGYFVDDEQAHQALFGALDDPDPTVQAEAIRSLVGVDGEMGERVLRRTVELLASTESTELRAAALDALARLGHGLGGARPLLATLLDATDPGLRAAAAEALQRMKVAPPWRTARSGSP